MSHVSFALENSLSPSQPRALSHSLPHTSTRERARARPLSHWNNNTQSF